jgi:hypothetical protein
MGVGWGMDWNLALDIVLLVGILAVLRGLVEIKSAVEQGIEDLDHRLAATIQKLVEDGLGGFEPPSPIQQAIASMLTQRASGPLVEVLRDEGGQFIKSEGKP